MESLKYLILESRLKMKGRRKKEKIMHIGEGIRVGMSRGVGIQAGFSLSHITAVGEAKMKSFPTSGNL